MVKHFKWEPRGKRRLHQTPNAAEVQACRPWLEAELSWIKPAVVVSLGSTASQALLGPQFRVLKGRGRVLRTNWAPALVATIHPSAVYSEQPIRKERLNTIECSLRISDSRLVRFEIPSCSSLIPGHKEFDQYRSQTMDMLIETRRTFVCPPEPGLVRSPQSQTCERNLPPSWSADTRCAHLVQPQDRARTP